MSAPATAAPGVRRSLMSSAVYALASAAQRALTLLLLPVFTSVLSTSQYGRLSLLSTIMGGASVVLAAGFEGAVMRRYFDLEGDVAAQRRFVLTTWYWTAAMPLLAVSVICVPVLVFLPGGHLIRPGELTLTLLGAAVLVPATSVPFGILRAEQRLKAYLAVTAASGVSTGLFVVLALVVLKSGVAGWLVAVLLSNAVTFAASAIVMPVGRLRQLDREGLRVTLRIGVPLIPHAFSLWSLQLADRIVLSALVSASSLGVYSLGSNLGLPAMVAMMALNQGLLPNYARTKGQVSGSAELDRLARMHVTIVFAIGCACALLAPPAIALVAPSSYGHARDFVAWIVLGYVFVGLYFIPMNIISFVIGQTRSVWRTTIVAAALNLAAVAVFVPRYGITAAAVASAAGYLILLVLVERRGRSMGAPRPLTLDVLGFPALLSGAAFAVGSVALPETGAVAFATRTAVILVLCAGLALPVPRLLTGAVARLRQ